MNIKILNGLILLLSLVFQLQVLAGNIAVTDQSGRALKNANVQIELFKSSEFQHFITDDNGIVELPRTNRGAFNLRVNKAGYMPLNLNLKNSSGQMSITLSRKDKPAGYIEILGETNGYPSLQQDGWIDFSLVLKSLDRKELVTFNMGNFISPETDTLSILGNDINVPSNVSIPEQTENYFFTVTFNKPEFRLYVPAADESKIFAIHGKMPLNKMVDDYQADKTFFEMLNNVDFLSLGDKVIKTNKDVKGLTITSATNDLDKKVSVTAPKLNNNKVMLAVSAFKEGDNYFFTDIKKVEAGGKVELTTKKNNDSYLISILLNDSEARSFRELSLFLMDNPMRDNKYDFNQMSYHIYKGSSVTPKFLPLVPEPAFSESKALVTATIPAVASGINAYASVVNLYRIASVSQEYSVEQRELLYSNSTAGWTDKFDLSGKSFNFKKGETYAWEVIYLGSDNASYNNAINWDVVTHVTRNSVQFIK